MDTQDVSIEGPLVEVADAAFLGNHNEFITAQKYLTQEEPLSKNFIRYYLSTNSWEWITKFLKDSLRWIEVPRPNPKGSKLVFSRHLDNAWQLFMMDSAGNNEIQLTELGGSDVSWSKDGRYVYFNRDTHKAPGARYIPHYYELATGKTGALWPELPDSVPPFPPLETQHPIDFRAIVQDSASVSN